MDRRGFIGSLAGLAACAAVPSAFAHPSAARRYSGVKGDPGTRALQEVRSRGLYVNAYVDGKLIPHAVTADLDGGYVVAHKLGSDGGVSLDRNREIVSETLYGQVDIEFSDHPLGEYRPFLTPVDSHCNFE